MVRVLVVPTEDVTITGNDNVPTVNRGPKYILWERGTGTIDVHWGARDYGKLDFMIICADLSAADITFLNSQTDVDIIPADLDTTVGAALSVVKSHLESRNIPADWVTAGTSWRTLVRAALCLFLYAQRYHNLFDLGLIRAGFTLDTLISDLPAGEVNRLNLTAQSLGLDTSSISGSTSLRQALGILGSQWSEPIVFGNLVTL